MLLPDFAYYRPDSMGEALEIMGRYGGSAKALAGGTDLLANLKRKTVKAEAVVSLDGIDGLNGLSASNGTIEIGPLTRAARLSKDPLVTRFLAVLSQGASVLGSPQVRNRATIGGNLCTARPAGDLLGPLLVLDAKLVLKSAAGQREAPAHEFFTGPGQTVIKPEELLSKVLVKKLGSGQGGAYEKLGLRRAMEISLVNVAAYVELAADGTIAHARVALGAVAPTPMRAFQAEESLRGAKADEESVRRAADLASSEARPIDDHRGTAAYRREVVKALTKRALNRAIAAARG